MALTLAREPMSKFKTLAASAFALLLSAACQHLTASPSVEIKRSGVLGYATITTDTAYWLDNDRVLFIGGKPGVFEKLPDGRQPHKRFLMEWNTSTGEVKTHAEMGADSNALCYDRGYVRYGFSTGNRTVSKAGLLGQEVDITTSVLKDGVTRRRVNPLTCREYDQQFVRSTYGEGFLPLKEERSYLGGRPDALQRKMSVYITAVNGEQRELLVPVLGTNPRWSEYAGAYVLRRSEDLFSATKTTGKLWLLMPSGATKEFDIPAGPWFRGSTSYGITKRGIFMRSHAIANFGNGDAGGYLIEANKPERFIEGYIFSFSVSPDGCKIALNIKSAGEADDRAEMVMANVCARGN